MNRTGFKDPAAGSHRSTAHGQRPMMPMVLPYAAKQVTSR